MLLAHTQTPIEASWTPLRSSRTATSAPPATSAIRYMPGPIDLDPERLERAAVQRLERRRDRARRLDEPGAGGKPSEEAERRLLASGPVHRADPPGLEAELEHALELHGLLAGKLAFLDGGGERDQAVAVGLVARGRQHGLHLAQSDLALLRLDGDASARRHPRPCRGSRAARARSRPSRSRSASRTPWARPTPTTSGPRASARPAAIGTRARRAADRGVALRVERMDGHVVLPHVVPHLVLRPLRERVQLHDRAVVVVDLDLADVGAARPLVAAQAGDPGVDAAEVPRQRLHLAHVAAEQPLLDRAVEEVRPMPVDEPLQLRRVGGEERQLPGRGSARAGSRSARTSRSAACRCRSRRSSTFGSIR